MVIRYIFSIGQTFKTAAKSRVSIFVEFALQLLADAVKTRKGRVQQQRDEDVAMVATLEPFVPLISECLKLKYDKVRN